jgi:hypothetical protein
MSEVELRRAQDFIDGRALELATKAIEGTSRLAGTMDLHLRHHDKIEAEASHSREELQKSIGKVHIRINQIGIGVILLLLSSLGYLLVNGTPWSRLNG